jgi:hypothetical protein
MVIHAKLSLMAQQAQNQLPMHLIGRTPVVVIDARDRPLRLDLDTIQSLEASNEPRLLRGK